MAANLTAPRGVALERHYSVHEIAQLWAVAPTTVSRIFRDLDDVLKIDMPTVAKRKKPRQTLRIPASVLMRVHEERSRGFRLEVESRRRGVK